MKEVGACPECVAGKHRNCDGRSWDYEADGFTVCPCAGAGHGVELIDPTVVQPRDPVTRDDVAFVISNDVPSPEAVAAAEQRYPVQHYPNGEGEAFAEGYDRGRAEQVAVLVAGSREALIAFFRLHAGAGYSRDEANPYKCKCGAFYNALTRDAHMADALLASGTVQLRTPEDGPRANPILSEFLAARRSNGIESASDWLEASWEFASPFTPAPTVAEIAYTLPILEWLAAIEDDRPAGEWQEVPRG